MTCNEMALMANIAVDMQKNEVNDVLDAIQKEIEKELKLRNNKFFNDGLEFALEIIDKYRKRG